MSKFAREIDDFRWYHVVAEHKSSIWLSKDNDPDPRFVKSIYPEEYSNYTFLEADSLKDAYLKARELGLDFTTEETFAGWLSPTGEHFRTGTYGHQTFAEMWIDKDELEMENEGWIKITRDHFTHKIVWRGNRPTQVQQFFLDNHNIQER